jgi:hypothetical protein
MRRHPFFYWSAGRCAVTDAPLEQLAVCRLATADPSARSTRTHDHPWITIPWITIPWIKIPLDHDHPWITINPCNPLILSVALQSGCRGPALAVHRTAKPPVNAKDSPLSTASPTAGIHAQVAVAHDCCSGMSWCWPHGTSISTSSSNLRVKQTSSFLRSLPMAIGGGPFFYWSAGRCTVTHPPLEQLAVCRCAGGVAGPL